MFEWCSLLCVVRMGTGIGGRKLFWLPAFCFSVLINSHSFSELYTNVTLYECDANAIMHNMYTEKLTGSWKQYTI